MEVGGGKRRGGDGLKSEEMPRLKVRSRGFSDRKSLTCAGLMVLWVFCLNLGGSCV